MSELFFCHRTLATLLIPTTLLGFRLYAMDPEITVAANMGPETRDRAIERMRRHQNRFRPATNWRNDDTHTIPARIPIRTMPQFNPQSWTPPADSDSPVIVTSMNEDIVVWDDDDPQTPTTPPPLAPLARVTQGAHNSPIPVELEANEESPLHVSPGRREMSHLIEYFRNEEQLMPPPQQITSQEKPRDCSESVAWSMAICDHQYGAAIIREALRRYANQQWLDCGWILANWDVPLNFLRIYRAVLTERIGEFAANHHKADQKALLNLRFIAARQQLARAAGRPPLW